MDVRQLLEGTVQLDRLGKVLDEIGHPGRVWATSQWGRKELSALYDAAEGFRPISVADFVPDGTAPLREVIHHGKNTLPVFSHFQKRFCLPSEETEAKLPRLYGYNHQAMGAFTGPGYFVTRPGDKEGQVDIDYTLTPKEKAASWPPIVPPSARLGLFVYKGMVDVMRGVSSHVTIGRAYKGGKPMDAWFVLVREDVA